MSGFLRATALLGSVSVLTLLVSVVRTKIVAVEVGRAGMAVVAQFSDTSQLISALLLLGTEQGMVAIATDVYARGDEAALARLQAMVRRRVGVPAVAALLLAALTTPWTVPAITGQPDHALPMSIALLALAAQLLVRPWRAILTGAKALGLIARLDITTAVLGLMFVIPLVLARQVEGAVWSLATTQLAMLGAALWIWRRRPPVANAEAQQLTDAEMASHLAIYGAGTLVSMLIGRGLSMAMRREIIWLHGLEEAGLYQVAYSLTQQYLTIVLGAMSAYTFPTYRAIWRDPERLVREIRSTLRGALLVITPIIIGLLGVRTLLIRLLFSADYLPAQDLLQIQLVGDLFKIIAWCVGLPILASGRVRVHVLLDLLLSSTLLLGVWAWSQAFGRLGPPIAFATNFGLATVVYLVAIWRIFGVGLGRDEVRTIAACAALVLGTALATDDDWLRSMLVSAVAIGLFAGLVVRRQEWKALRALVERKLRRGGGSAGGTP